MHLTDAFEQSFCTAFFKYILTEPKTLVSVASEPFNHQN